ncbi:Exocyst complex component [Seminavis robusta]|uniref:Exocyst complex component n=1 Tax=Seminavis robusta TaxID=568900 RepID=A0A9N8DIB8_9STRA|nr:Exocyst complex component [Seminavis robusta]|eukprot:Sro142_g066320.1 Exocyst complex component (534) ;mRNA; r:75357-77078
MGPPKLSVSSGTSWLSGMSMTSQTDSAVLQSFFGSMNPRDFMETTPISEHIADVNSVGMNARMKRHLQPKVVTPPRRSMAMEVSSPQRGQDWSVPVSKFLQGFRVQAAASLSNAYRTHHPMNRSVTTGILTTSLAEDIFFLVDVQLNVLHDFLEDAGILNSDDGEDVIEDALLAIFRCIWAEQTRHRETFLTSFDMCCATANDFFRMMTRIEDLMTDLELKYPFLEWNALDGDTKTEVIRREANDLATLFVSDAVYASQSSHLYVMRNVRESTVTEELFSRDWEDRYTHNEVILTMLRGFEEYNNDLQNFLCNDFLYHKVVVALVRATVCFFVELLLKKSSYVRRKSTKKFGKSEEDRRKALPFACPARALCRMMYDIRFLQDYFHKISQDSQPLTRVVANEMNTLTIIHEFLGLAVGHTGLDSLEEFMVVIHKRSGANADVTRHFLNDLWFLAAPHEEKERINNTFALMKGELEMVSARMKESIKKPKMGNHPDGREVTPQLENTLREYYEDRIWQEKISGCGGMLKAHHMR